MKYGACLCLVLSGDLARHSFSLVFHGKRLHHVNYVGIRVHYHAGFPSCVYVRTEVDFGPRKERALEKTLRW